MRKCVRLVLLMLLAASICASASADPYMSAIVQTPGIGDISRDEAYAIAKDAYANAAGEAYDDAFKTNKIACLLAIELLGDTQRAWYVSLQQEPVEGNRMVGIAVLSPSGEIVEVQGYIRDDRRAEWETEKGPYALWSDEDKALFYHLYEKMESEQVQVMSAAGE